MQNNFPENGSCQYIECKQKKSTDGQENERCRREDWGERAEETVEKEGKRKDGDGDIERQKGGRSLTVDIISLPGGDLTLSGPN